MAALIVIAAVAASRRLRTSPSSRSHGEERRDEWQKVGEIFKHMGVGPGSVVADIGAGDGFFTSQVATRS